jgi:hypothetical protein
MPVHNRLHFGTTGEYLGSRIQDITLFSNSEGGYRRKGTLVYSKTSPLYATIRRDDISLA